MWQETTEAAGAASVAEERMTGWLLFKTMLAILACYRLSRLVAYDKVFARLRQSVKPKSFVGKFLSCPYCTGIWFAIPLAYLVGKNDLTALFVLMVLGIAGAQDYLESMSGGDRD